MNVHVGGCGWGGWLTYLYANLVVKLQTFSSEKVENKCQRILLHSWCFQKILVSIRRDLYAKKWSVYMHELRLSRTQIYNKNWQNCVEWLFRAYFGPYHQNKGLQTSEMCQRTTKPTMRRVRPVSTQISLRILCFYVEIRKLMYTPVNPSFIM